MKSLNELLNGEKSYIIGPIFVAFAAFLWATDLAVRPALNEGFGKAPNETLQFVFLEHLIALTVYIVILLIAWRFYEQTRVSLNLNQFRSLGRLEILAALVIGIGGSALGLFFFSQAFAEAGQLAKEGIFSGFSQTLFVQKIQPLFAIGFAAWILHERLPPAFFLITILALIGVIFVSLGTDPFVEGATFPYINLDLTPSNRSLLIAIYALFAAFFWGISTVFGRILVQKISYQLTTLIRYVVGTTFLLIMNILLGTNFASIISTGITLMWQLVYVAIVPGVLSLFIYYIGLQRTKASVATIAELTFPFSFVLWDHIFNKASMFFMQWLGAIIVLTAITIIVYINARQFETETDFQPKLKLDVNIEHSNN